MATTYHPGYEGKVLGWSHLNAGVELGEFLEDTPETRQKVQELAKRFQGEEGGSVQWFVGGVEYQSDEYEEGAPLYIKRRN